MRPVEPPHEATAEGGLKAQRLSGSFRFGKVGEMILWCN